jgi:hypothetical protein
VCFVIKMFDIFNIKTIQLLYILRLHYKEMYFYKPDTSRLSNSEKYIVCKGFTGLILDIKNLMVDSYNDLERFKIFVPTSFLNDLDKFNQLFIKIQIKNIIEVLNIIDNISLNKTNKKQIDTAINWCKKYNVDINSLYEIKSRNF